MKSVQNLNGLRALEAAVRLGNFKLAAQELGVTPAAVGQQVRNLEKTLGNQLLIRQANGFEVSRTAHSAASRLTAGFDELRSAIGIIQQSHSERSIYVTVTPSIAERWLVPRLSALLEKFPDINLRIDSTPYNLYKTDGEFDFALRYARSRSANFDETTLFNETLIPLCTPEVAGQLGEPNTKERLAHAKLIHVDASTDDPDWLDWQGWGNIYGYDIPKTKSRRLHFAFTTLALRALYEGQGLHLAQLSITLPDLMSGTLIAPFGKSKCIKPGYCYRLTKLSPGPSTVTQRVFRNWMIQEARKTQEDINRYIAYAETSPTGT